MEMTDFAANLPYPTLEGIEVDCSDLQRIKNDYGGRVSEFSAIGQYVYHQLIAKEGKYEGVGRSLLSVAQVEMRHLNILGMLQLKLGGDPRFVYLQNCHLRPWSGALIEYGVDIRDMLQSDLRLEEETIACYHSQAMGVNQPQVAAVLERIIQDEEIHVRVLKGLLLQI